MSDIAKAIAFDKVIDHLDRAAEVETRPREVRRIRIARKHLLRFLAEAEAEATNFPHEAINAIWSVLEVGRAKGYPPGSWRNEPIREHLLKAAWHLVRFLAGVQSDENHLEHALCRLAMGVALVRAYEIE